MADKKKKKDPLADAVETIKKQTENAEEGGQLGVGKNITDLLQYLAKKFPDAWSSAPPAETPEGGGQMKPMSPAEKLFGG